jgi:hypothetical protein
MKFSDSELTVFRLSRSIVLMQTCIVSLAQRCVMVRRETAHTLSGGSPTRQLSFRPVAILAGVEATKRLKPRMERIVRAIPRARRP